MAKNLPYLVCPVCFRNLCLKRIRLKRDRPHYNLWDKTKPIIYIRECRGGKKSHEAKLGFSKPGWPPGSGFPIIERILWDEAIENEEYKPILNEIKEQVKKLAIELFSNKEREELANSLMANKEKGSIK